MRLLKFTLQDSYHLAYGSTVSSVSGNGLVYRQIYLQELARLWDSLESRIVGQSGQWDSLDCGTVAKAGLWDIGTICTVGYWDSLDCGTF